AAELMVKQGSGHIINIGSLAGVAPVAGISLYSASKFALRGFSLATALELRDHGVHVSVVSMDVVDTPMLDPQYEMKESAVSFSGKRILRIEEVEAAILKCMQKKRVEVLIPAGRGWMSKLANILPSLAQPIYRSMVKKGRKRQAEKVEQRKAAGLMD
ncbi:MAG: SDR family NAD(P)-dependent oxidoreductase, partial [Deltaproteobacteria bacterium]|nr:SDR family NAD(P)-dependent oxidoreductase [Deltaproteobacteria bacterium]